MKGGIKNMSNNEEWRPLDEKCQYYVSNLGRVKSYKRDKVNGEILTPNDNGKGYKCVTLSIEKGKPYRKYIHRLVASLFCTNYTKNCQVHHKNKDRADNRAENLQCVTIKQHTKIHKKRQ